MSTITSSASLSTATSLTSTASITGGRSAFSVSGGQFPTGVTCAEPLETQALSSVGIAIGQADKNSWPAITHCLNQGELDLIVDGTQCGVVYYPASSQDLMSAYTCVGGIAGLGSYSCEGNCTDPNASPFRSIWTTITDATTSSATASSTGLVTTTTSATQTAATSQHTGAASTISPIPVNKMQWAVAAMTFISLCVGVAL